MGLTRITSDGITDGSIVNADINASAAIAGTKISPDFGSQAVTTTGQITGNSVTVNGDITLNDNQPRINFTDNNGNPDYLIQVDTGHFLIHDATNGADKIKIQSDGHIDITPNTDFGAGIDVTGASSFNGFITLSATHNRIIFTDTNDDPDYMVDSNGGHFLVYDATNNQDKIKIFSDGHTDIHGNVDFISGGIDVTGAITGTGDLTIDTNTLHVDSSNNRVGIGTSSPSNNLEVASADHTGILIQSNRTTSTSNIGALDFRSSSTDVARIQSLVDGTIKFRNTSSLTERMRIDSSGRVMIGTTTKGHAAADDLTISNTASGADMGITLRSATDGQGAIYFSDGTSGNDEYRGIINYNHSSNFFSFFTNATERMRIGSNGSVSIGKTSNEGKGLEVYQASDAALRIQNSTTGTGSTDGVLLEASGSDFLVFNYESGNLRFGTAGTERMRVTSGGDVGIGVTSPTEKLEINLGTDKIVQFTGGIGQIGNVAGVFAVNDAKSEIADFGIMGNTLKFASGTAASGAERMRIMSSGKILVNTTSQLTYGGHFNIDCSSVSANALNVIGSTTNYVMVSNSSKSSGNHIFFANAHGGDNNTGTIQDNGSNVSYNTSSDYRIKENIVSISDGITRVKQLNPVRHTFKNNSAIGTVDGWLAHELDEVCPYAVIGEKDAVNEDGTDSLQGVDYGRISPLLTAALKEAIAKIETLETKVAALEAK